MSFYIRHLTPKTYNLVAAANMRKQKPKGGDRGKGGNVNLGLCEI